MYYLLIVVLVAVDQIVKYLIQANVDLNQTIPVIDGVFHITYIQNFGAAFSILQNQRLLLLIVSGAAILALFTYLVWKKKAMHWMASLSFSLIIAGGIGNLIDRFTKGYVVDFFDFRIWPIFNVADVAVCCGCCLLIFYVLFWERRVEQRQKG